MLSKFKTLLAAATLLVASAGANALSVSTIGNAQYIESANVAVLSTAAGEEGVPVTAAALEGFAGLSAGDLDGLGLGTVIDGSAIKSTVTVTAGDVFSFDWFWLTTDFLPYDDFAFLALSATSESSLETIVSVSALGDFTSGSGSYATDAFLVDTVLTFVIGIVDVGFGDVESRINITNLSPVPVPAAALLFGSALLGFAGFSARRKIS